MPSFQCQSCGKDFQVAQLSLDKFPGWNPKMCRSCKNPRGPSTTRSSTSRSSSAATPVHRSHGVEQLLTTAEVLEKYSDGPNDGVFTDGASHPNPGPGGWGAVFVRDGHIIAEAYGHEPSTTNNRMELTALIRGVAMVPKGERATIWTDSQLCVNTVLLWAAGWERSGWKRKTGPIKNLDLVQELYAACRARPELELKWIKAHTGYRWNEYADALATAYRRETK